MTLLNSKFTLTGDEPIAGARGGLYMSLQPQEIASAFEVGTGPGVPDDEGTPVAGTIREGHIVTMNTTGNAVLMTSPDLTAALPQLPFLVVSGDEDFSALAAGQINGVHGGARADTERYNTASSYAPNMPLIAVSGVLEPKVLGDNKQTIAFVGPRGLVAGILDILMPQGISG